MSLLCKDSVAFREIFSKILGDFRKNVRRFWKIFGRFGNFMRPFSGKLRTIFEKSPKELLRGLNFLKRLLKMKAF
jgi:hypothetical protein